MAKAVVPATESESEVEVQPTNKESVAKQTSNEEVEMDDEGGNEGEEEYEIEEILDAKRGTFPEGRMGYFVKWKGYDESNNSWVDEIDAANSHALIEEYWRLHKKDKREKSSGGRKSIAAAPKGSASKPRKNSAVDESSEAEVAPPPKKRGRPSAASKAAKSKSEEPVEEEAPAPKKKQKKNKKDAMDVDDADDADGFRDMSKYHDMPTWDHVVESIDTVERQADGVLMVYFTLKGKGRARENSDICKTKMAHKLLSFYEDNLRWKPASEDEED